MSNSLPKFLHLSHFLGPELDLSHFLGRTILEVNVKNGKTIGYKMDRPKKLEKMVTKQFGPIFWPIHSASVTQGSLFLSSRYPKSGPRNGLRVWRYVKASQARLEKECRFFTKARRFESPAFVFSNFDGGGGAEDGAGEEDRQARGREAAGRQANASESRSACRQLGFPACPFSPNCFLVGRVHLLT